MHRAADSRPSCLRFAVPFLREILPEAFPSVSRRRVRRLGTTGNRGALPCRPCGPGREGMEALLRFFAAKFGIVHPSVF